MKYLLTPILCLLASFTYACFIPPQEVAASAELGFEFEIEPSPWCEECNQLSITAPVEYESAPFSHGLFTVSLNQDVVSRSIHSSMSEAGVPEFIGVVSSQSGFSYEVTFEYGHSRCMSYQFIYQGEANGS